MRTIFIILIGFIIIGCGEKISPKLSKKNSKNANGVTESNTSIDLEGNYTLESGRYAYSKNLKAQNIIKSAKLSIEKLDNDDYGYFAVITVENTPMIYTGIIHHEGNGFLKKIIVDRNQSDKNISENNVISENTTLNGDNIINCEELTTNTTNEIKITKTENGIKTFIPFEGTSSVASIKWIKIDSLGDTQEIKDAQHEYILYYRNRFKKCFSF